MNYFLPLEASSSCNFENYSFQSNSQTQHGKHTINYKTCNNSKWLSTGKEVHQYNLDASSTAHVALKRKYCCFINSMIHIFYLLAYNISKLGLASSI